MTTWAIDGNSWDSDQTNWNTAPIVGFQDTDSVLSMASSVATSAVHRLVGIIDEIIDVVQSPTNTMIMRGFPNPTWAEDSRSWSSDTTDWSVGTIGVGPYISPVANGIYGVGASLPSVAGIVGINNIVVVEAMAFSATPSVALVANGIYSLGLTLPSSSAIQSDGFTLMTEAASLTSTAAITNSYQLSLVGDATIDPVASVTGSSVMLAVGAATLLYDAEMPVIANGNYSLNLNLAGAAITVVDARLFWEPEIDAAATWTTATLQTTTWTDTSDSSITWTDKSDDTKP